MNANDLFTFKLVEGYIPHPNERMRLNANGSLWIQFEGRMYEAIPRNDGVVEAVVAQAHNILTGWQCEGQVKQ